MGNSTLTEKAPTPKDCSFPLVTDLGVGVTLTVFSYVIPSDLTHSPFPVWTFLSKGLSGLGQQEIVITIRRRTSESPAAFPQGLIAYFRSVVNLSQQGCFVEAGGYTQFSKPLVAGKHITFMGLFYHNMSSGTLPPEFGIDSALVGVLISEAELKTGLNFGVYRILSRLGVQAQFCPFPLWTDPDRQAIASDFEKLEQTSILAKVPICTLSATNSPRIALIDKTSVEVAFDPIATSALKELVNSAPPDAAFSIYAQPCDSLDGCFYWSPGSQGPAATVKPNSSAKRLNGLFLLLCPGVDDQEEVKQTEDGFVAIMKGSTYQQFKEALLHASPYIFQPAIGLPLKLIWRSTTFRNPIDGQIFSSRLYQPEHSESTSQEEIRLLSPEAQLSQAVSVTALGDYLGRIITAVRKHLPQPQVVTDSSSPLQSKVLTIQFTLSAGQPACFVADSSLGADLSKSIADVEPPSVRIECKFLVLFQIDSE